MTAIENLPVLPDHEMRNLFEPRILERGRVYQREGAVESIRVDEELGRWIIYATVAGSGHRPYYQVISIAHGPPPEIRSLHCSCPYPLECKHLAAVLFSLRRSGGATGEAVELERWLGNIRAVSQASDLLTRRETWLIFQFSPVYDRYGWPSLAVQPRLLKRRRNGEWSKGRKIALNDVSMPGFHVEDVDRQGRRLAEMIDNSAPLDSDVRAPVLEGPMAATVLLHTIRAARAYWQDEWQQPLAAGPDRPLTLEWRREGDYQVLRREPRELHLVLADPPVYIDDSRHEAGLFDTVLSAEMLSGLLQAPPVPREQAKEISLRLMQAAPGNLDLPTPAEIEIHAVEGLNPQPVLYLTRDGSGRVAVLRQQYGDFELPCEEPVDRTDVLRGDALWQVERDLGQEIILVHRLLDLGLAPVLSDAGGEGLPARNDLVLAFAGPDEKQLAAWQQFVYRDLPQLDEEGWVVHRDDGFDLEVIEAEAIEVSLDETSGEDWFGLGLGIEVDGERIDLLPVLAQVLETLPDPQALAERSDPVMLPLEDGRHLALPPQRLAPLVGTLYELFQRPDSEHRLSRSQAMRLLELDEQDYAIRGAGDLQKQFQQLAKGRPARPVKPPRALKATLRDYQLEGMNWLSLMRETGCHGILADDMGLGKTMQTLAHLLREKQAGRLLKPSLLVAPTSVVSNWRREAERFAPTLTTLVLHGQDRSEYFDEIEQYDLILTTYPLLSRDETVLADQAWYYLVLDEAHHIKNPRTRAAQCVRRLNAEHRLCLTGTPMENHLGELWALFDFLMPGLLGDARQFKRLFRTPIERHQDPEARDRLHRRVRPFLLRRTKDAVVRELPSKIEIPRALTLSGGQADLYETVRLSMEERVRKALDRKGLAQSHITVLDALLKLRQVCCDPRLLPAKSAASKQKVPSAKLQYLRELLPDLVEEGRRILLFSQFTSMLTLIGQELDDLGLNWVRLTGRTRKRDAVIQRFRDGEAPIFLISLKAGGVGLNLIEADTVIHYDPWWNPAVENQATDRAHRIGQDKSVFVYKLVTENTVEEKILALQARKQGLADGLSRQGQSASGFSEDDVRELLQPLA